MSKWDTGPSLCDRGLVLVEYTDEFDDDVYAAMQYEHRRQGWCGPSSRR